MFRTSDTERRCTTAKPLVLKERTSHVIHIVFRGGTMQFTTTRSIRLRRAKLNLGHTHAGAASCATPCVGCGWPRLGRLKNRRGFTLIELLVVIALIGIL